MLIERWIRLLTKKLIAFLNLNNRKRKKKKEKKKKENVVVSSKFGLGLFWASQELDAII